MTKLIEKLHEELSTAVARLEAAEAEVNVLKKAIAALEGQSKKRKHLRSRPGSISDAVLNCVRQGIGEVRHIRIALEAQGVHRSPNSISNAIGRLQNKSIRFDFDTKKWVPISQGTDAPISSASVPSSP